MRIGELLISKRLINEEELNQALELQKDRGEKLGRILIDLGFIAYKEVLLALSEQLQIPLVVLDGPPPAIPEAEGLSPRFLRQSRCLPIGLTEAGLQLAMADPLDFETMAAVRGFTGLRVVPALAGEQEIIDAIDRYFADRNAYFQTNPQRAGKRIWGKEREPACFSEANNCKDPRYR